MVNVNLKEIKKLNYEGKLSEYKNFSNNGIKSFNHLLNEYIIHNNKVSFVNFENIVFIINERNKRK